MRGIYVLAIKIKNEISPAIGVLGRMKFSPGLYAYVGSAQSNLEQRISRHLRKNKQLFWHIDYLLDDDSAEVAEVFVKNNALRTEECSIADIFRSKGEPLERFGCSDCECKGHLFKVKDFSFLEDSMSLFYQSTESFRSQYDSL